MFTGQLQCTVLIQQRKMDVSIKVMKACPYEALIGMDVLRQLDGVVMDLTTGNLVEISPYKIQWMMK